MCLGMCVKVQSSEENIDPGGTSPVLVFLPTACMVERMKKEKGEAMVIFL